MGFQGSLSSVNLGDILQTLAMNRQTGSLVVHHAGSTRSVWFEEGNIAITDGTDKDGGPVLLHVLQQRSLLTPDQAAKVEERMLESNTPQREVLLDQALITAQEVDDLAAACIEDRVCEIFEWNTGSFEFVDGDPVAQLQRPDAIDCGETCLATQSVVMEAMRRRDEWERIREVIPDHNELFIVDAEGRNNLRNLGEDHDPDMLKVLRLLDGRSTIDDIAILAGVPRFDSYAIVSQLVLAGVARSRAPQEIVDDALNLRESGETSKAAALLENAAINMRIPEVLRPLAELKLELQETPRAVELYLELIQRAQDDGDLEQALKDLDIGIEINPDDPELHLDRAECLIDLNRDEEAAKEFIAAANGFLSTRDSKQAMKMCHRAKDLSPAAPEPHAMLAKAHLLDSAPESAIVEYKSLWHTLLSAHSPKKALEELSKILDRDCKFASVKTQVIEHARGSEAVKTSSALRLLIYVVIVLAIGGAGYYGYTIYERDIAHTNRVQQAKELEDQLQNSALETNFDDIDSRLRELKVKSANTNAEFERQLEDLTGLYDQQYQAMAKRLLDRYQQQVAEGQLDEAADSLDDLATRFEDSTAAQDIETLRSNLSDQRTEARISEDISAIEQDWQALQWDDSIEKLEQVLATAQLTQTVRDRLEQQLNQYQTQLKSSEFLFRKGEELEKLGRSTDAIRVYERALDGDNDYYRDEARKKLIAVEESFTEQKVANIKIAITQNDPEQVFRLLDELVMVASNSKSALPKQELAALNIPLRVNIEHHAVTVTAINASGDQRTYTAPAGHTGAWQLDLQYPAQSKIVVSAARTGFRPFERTFSAEDRTLKTLVPMVRSHLWQIDLRSQLATVPVVSGAYVLAVTRDSRLHILDASSGSGSTMAFDPLYTFNHPPFLPPEQNQTAYLTLGGQIHMVDIGTRARVSWPETQALDSPNLGKHGLFAWEGLLGNAGQHQIFTGSQPPGSLESGELVTLNVGAGSMSAFPATRMINAATGPAVGDRDTGLLFVPAGQHLRAYDTTTGSLSRPMEERFHFQISNEMTLRPVLATVMGRGAVLIADNTGQVIALDADPDADNQDRRLFAWNLPSAAAASPVVDADSRTAYIPLEGGGVVAIALDHPDQQATRWRFPVEGTIASLPGTCAVGTLGLYVADTNGILYAIDRNTGTERWRVDLKSGAAAGVATSNGRVFVGTRGNYLLCFEEGEP